MSDKFNNPWGDNNNNNGKEPDDLDEMIKKGQDKVIDFLNNVKKGKKGGGNTPPELPMVKLGVIGLLVIMLGWLSTGFYTIQPDEVGVVLRLGDYNRSSVPGLNYKLPSPLETVEKVSVTRVNREEIGYKSSTPSTRSRFFKKVSNNTASLNVAQESEMLTGDENIVSIDFEVQWRIKEAKDYLFNVKDVGAENTVKISAESAMREVIGLSKISDALAGERSKIESEAKTLLQEMLDNYKMGVEIIRVQMLRVEPPTEVIDAYRDVQSAKADKEREINKAYSYNNDILPRARGEAEQIVKQAEGYKERVIAKAQGEADRFIAIHEEYRKAKDVTRKRMYLETMETVMEGMNKVILDPKKGSNVLPFLPLNEMVKNNKNGQK